MKIKAILWIILLAVFFAGCKKEESATEVRTQTPRGIGDFKVVIDVVAQKDDHFALYYTTDGSINFFNIPPVWEAVKGSDRLQKVSFVVPKHIVPTQLRIDFGMKQEQPDIVLKKIQMEYLGKKIDIAGMQIFDYFQIDVRQCTADPGSGTIKAKMKDGKRLTPSIYPNPELLSKQIEKLIQ